MSVGIWKKMGNDGVLTPVAGNLQDNINDSVSSKTSTYSSDKIDEITNDIFVNLGEKLTSVITIAEDTIDLNSCVQDGRYFINGVTLINAPNGVSQGMLIVNDLTNYSCVQTFVNDANKVFSRTKWYSNWTAWQELATMDKIAHELIIDARAYDTIDSAWSNIIYPKVNTAGFHMMNVTTKGGYPYTMMISSENGVEGTGFYIGWHDGMKPFRFNGTSIYYTFA